MLSIQKYQMHQKDKIRIDTIILSLYLLMLPFDFFNTGMGSIPKYVSVAVIGIVVLCNIRNFKINMAIISILAIYFVLNYISSAYSINGAYPRQRAMSLFLNYLLIIICASSKKNENELEFLKKVLAISGWIVVGLMFFFNGSLEGGGERLTVMVDGQEQDPNYLCGYMLFSVAYYLDIIFNKEKKVWAIISILIFFTVVIATGSRGGTLAIILTCIFFYLLDNKNKHKIRNLFMILLVGFGVLYIANRYISMDVLTRFTKEFNETNQGAGRLEIWESAMMSFSEFNIFNKFFGVGSATIQYYTYTAHVAHNLWIETLVELGVLGLVMLSVMYSIFIKYGFKLKSKIYLASLLGYIAMTMTMSLYTYKPIFTIFMLIAMSYKQEFLDKKG